MGAKIEYWVAALPSVGTRFSAFKSNYPTTSRFSFSEIERKLWKLAGTKPGVSLLEQHFLHRFQSESGLLNSPIIRRYMGDVYSRRWRNPPKHLQSARCALCSLPLQLGDMVFHPRTQEIYNRLWHRKCFETARVDEIGQWFDGLDAVAKMHLGFSGFSTKLAEVRDNDHWVNPYEVIRWEQLRAHAQRAPG